MHVLLNTRKGHCFTAGLCAYTYVQRIEEKIEDIATVYINILGSIDQGLGQGIRCFVEASIVYYYWYTSRVGHITADG